MSTITVGLDKNALASSVNARSRVGLVLETIGVSDAEIAQPENIKRNNTRMVICERRELHFNKINHISIRHRLTICFGCGYLFMDFVDVTNQLTC